MAADKEPVIPGLIGNFNIPKAVIENKVDVLTFLELMVRKGIVTPEELDDIRSAVVAHLNSAFPELELSYSTPEGGNKGPFNPPAPAAPKSSNSGGFANAAFNSGTPQPSIAASSMMAPLPEQKKSAEGSAAEPAAAPAEAPKAPAANPDKPLWVQAPPPRFIK
jgi:hypothetical protein